MGHLNIKHVLILDPHGIFFFADWEKELRELIDGHQKALSEQQETFKDVSLACYEANEFMVAMVPAFLEFMREFLADFFRKHKIAVDDSALTLQSYENLLQFSSFLIQHLNSSRG